MAPTSLRRSSFWLVTALLSAAACSPGIDDGIGGSGGSFGSGASGPQHAGGSASTVAPSTGVFSTGNGGGAPCKDTCSTDHTQVLSCQGAVLTTCTGDQRCDLVTGGCADACTAAVDNHEAGGCSYYAVQMDTFQQNDCFAAFVANTSDKAAHITVDYGGTSLPVASFARLPSGSGSGITYAPYDSVGGLPPGKMAILFLAGGENSSVPCPITSAIPSGAQFYGTSGIGNAFHISTDTPASAYEINPYGGGSAAVTGASLLLQSSSWGTNYLGVTAGPLDAGSPSMNIISAEDGTEVTILPKVAITGGNGLAAGPANVPYTFTLNKGQQAQFTQAGDLNGSPIESTKPIGFIAGQPCLRAPFGISYCDHAEQMLPPVKALGNEYAAVMFRPRVSGDIGIWRLVGTTDGTTLTYSTPVGGPATLNQGDSVVFNSGTPFTVKSQDDKHPFMLFTYMSGSEWTQLSDITGYGDADFVLNVPPAQFLTDYIFYTDQTYPETNLVVIRTKDQNGLFQDVNLDCAGVLQNWQPVGDYEWTRVDLSTGNFQPVAGCNNGQHEIKSTALFGLTVWGWGTPKTTAFTANVSYGYPGGMNVAPINTVVVPPVPQ